MSSFAQTNKKRNWNEIGCSKQSLYVEQTRGGKRVYVDAKLSCEERSRLLGFDSSVCSRCAPARASDQGSSPTPRTPPGGGTNGGSTGTTTGGSSTGGSTTSSHGDTGHPNNGHGNDEDGNDSSNPGHSNNGDGTDDDGAPGNGHGKDASR